MSEISILLAGLPLVTVLLETGAISCCIALLQQHLRQPPYS